MALNAPAALARAQVRSTWNRIVRQAGFGGEMATWAMLALVAATLFFPALLTLRIGRDLGYELAASGDAGVFRNWNGLMAVLTVGFALLGSFRQKPSFPFARFGRFPVTPLELLLADLPASLFEVFPLLCATAAVFLNVGLASRMPAWSPVVALLAVESVLSMLSLMIIVSALWSVVARSRVAIAAVVLAAVMIPQAIGLRGLRVVLKEWLPGMAQEIPIARGYAGLLALRAGGTSAGLAGLAVATIATALLLITAAYVQYWRIFSEVSGPVSRPRRERAMVFRSPSGGVSLLFLRQLLRSSAIRGQQLLPFFYTASIALVTVMVRAAVAGGKVLPEQLPEVVARAEALPLYAIVPLFAVAVNAQIWTNQFGWDRGGMRTLLVLPIDRGAILAGKLRGLAVFVAVQTVVGMAPLLWVRMPGGRELLAGLAAGGAALVVTTAVGHVVSMRYPRPVQGEAGVHIPLFLTWVSPATTLVSVGFLAGIYAVADLIVPGGGLVGLVLALASVIAGYRAILPRLGVLLGEHSERLVSM